MNSPPSAEKRAYEQAEAAARLRRVAREAQAWEMSLGDLEGAEKHLNRIASSAMHLH